MMGTFARFLGEERIGTHPSLYRAEARGYVREVDGILRVARIEVDYHLRAHESRLSAAQACLERYLSSCPAAMSVSPSIELAHRLCFVSSLG